MRLGSSSSSLRQTASGEKENFTDENLTIEDIPRNESELYWKSKDCPEGFSSMIPCGTSEGIELSYENFERCLQGIQEEIGERMQGLASNTMAACSPRNEKNFPDLYMPSSLSPVISTESENPTDFQKIHKALDRLFTEAVAAPQSETLEGNKEKLLDSVRVFLHRKHAASSQYERDFAHTDRYEPVEKVMLSQEIPDNPLDKEGESRRYDDLRDYSLIEEQSENEVDKFNWKKVEADSTQNSGIPDQEGEERKCQSSGSSKEVGCEGTSNRNVSEEVPSVPNNTRCDKLFLAPPNDVWSDGGEPSQSSMCERLTINASSSIGSVTSSDLGFLISTLTSLAGGEPSQLSADQIEETETNTLASSSMESITSSDIGFLISTLTGVRTNHSEMTEISNRVSNMGSLNSEQLNDLKILVSDDKLQQSLQKQVESVAAEKTALETTPEIETIHLCNRQSQTGANETKDSQENLNCLNPSSSSNTPCGDQAQCREAESTEPLQGTDCILQTKDSKTLATTYASSNEHSCTVSASPFKEGEEPLSGSPGEALKPAEKVFAFYEPVSPTESSKAHWAQLVCQTNNCNQLNSGGANTEKMVDTNDARERIFCEQNNSHAEATSSAPGYSCVASKDSVQCADHQKSPNWNDPVNVSHRPDPPAVSERIAEGIDFKSLVSRDNLSIEMTTSGHLDIIESTAVENPTKINKNKNTSHLKIEKVANNPSNTILDSAKIEIRRDGIFPPHLPVTSTDFVQTIDSTSSGQVEIQFSSSSPSLGAGKGGASIGSPQWDDVFSDASTSGYGETQSSESQWTNDVDQSISSNSVDDNGVLSISTKDAKSSALSLLQKPQRLFGAFKLTTPPKETPGKRLSKIVPPKARSPRKFEMEVAASIDTIQSPSRCSTSHDHNCGTESKERAMLKRVPIYIRKSLKAKKATGPICTDQYMPNLHKDRAACERCLYWASNEEKEKFQAAGRHLRVMLVRGGCDRSCSIFPREADEFPVRLCRKCFFDTHKSEPTSDWPR